MSSDIPPMRITMLLLLASATSVVGCVSSVTGPGGGAEGGVVCSVSSECPDGQACAAGTCVVPSSTCATDLECNVSLGEQCRLGACTVPASTGACAITSDCAVDSFCDQGTCAPLPDGLCRVDAQCAGSNATLCNALPGRVDRCVMCRTGADCESGVCFDNGNCAPPAPSSEECPPNSSPLPGTDTCKCNAGFIPNASGVCTPIDDGEDNADDGPGAVQCVLHAHPVPDVPGQCECDAGFEPSSTAAACVAVGSQPPPNSGGGPADPPPSGGEDGGAVEDDGCGPNSFALFFFCICFPGYVIDESGPGCIEDTSEPPPAEEPPVEQPVDEPPPADVEPEPSIDDGCPDNSSPDPFDDAYCICDEGYVVNDDFTACEEDACYSLGYYGDGEFCDDFCPQPDPDCG